MSIRAAIAHWYRGRELSRVEIVAALWKLPPAITPAKPNPNLLVWRGPRDVWDRRRKIA